MPAIISTIPPFRFAGRALRPSRAASAAAPLFRAIASLGPAGPSLALAAHAGEASPRPAPVGEPADAPATRAGNEVLGDLARLAGAALAAGLLAAALLLAAPDAENGSRVSLAPAATAPGAHDALRTGAMGERRTAPRGAFDCAALRPAAPPAEAAAGSDPALGSAYDFYAFSRPTGSAGRTPSENGPPEDTSTSDHGLPDSGELCIAKP